MGLVHHQAGAEPPAQLDDLRERRDVALHREDPVDDDQDPTAVAHRPLERALELVEPVVAERPQLGPREDAAVEDRRVVARVGDDRVPRGEDRPQGAQVGLVAGGEHQHGLGPHPLRQLLLESEVQVDGAVQETRAGQAGPVALERLHRAALDALVTRQTQVVVGAEHDPALALHLHDGQGGTLQHPEIRHQIELPRFGHQA